MQAILVVGVEHQDRTTHLCRVPFVIVTTPRSHTSASATALPPPLRIRPYNNLCPLLFPCPFVGALPGASADAYAVRTRVRLVMANCHGEVVRVRLSRRPLRTISMCAASSKMWLSEARGGNAHQLPAPVCKSLICALCPTCKNLHFFAGFACTVVCSFLAPFRLGLCCNFVIWYIIDVYMG